MGSFSKELLQTAVRGILRKKSSHKALG